MPPTKLAAPTPTRTSPAACRWRASQPPTMLHLPSHFSLTRKRAVSSMDIRLRWTVVGPLTEAGSPCASAIAEETSLNCESLVDPLQGSDWREPGHFISSGCGAVNVTASLPDAVR